MSHDTPEGDSKSTDNKVGEVLDRVERLLRGLRYGTITILVQDGVVVQIDRTEKVRLR